MESKGFGLWRECPEDVRAAWGARAILRDGSVDLLWDRQSSHGVEEDRKTFCKRVDKILPVVKAKVFELSFEWGGIFAGTAGTFTLYEDTGIVIRGDTLASHGYLYLIAFSKPGDEAWASIVNDDAPEVPVKKVKKTKKTKKTKGDWMDSFRSDRRLW